MIHGDTEIEVVEDLDGLVRLDRVWADIQDACPHKHVFLDRRFVAAWWRHIGNGKTLQTLVLRRGARVLGIVPLVLSSGWEAFPSRGKNVRIAEDFRHLPSTRWRRFVPVRRLTFPLSFPSAAIRSHLLLREDEVGLVDAALAYCASIRDRWDILFMDGIPAESKQNALLAELAPARGLHRGQARHARTLLHAKLPGSVDDFLAQRSANFRRSMRRALWQAEQHAAGAGGFRVREFRGTEIRDGMARLLDLEGRSWKAGAARRRQMHLTLDDRHRRFHLEAAEAFAAADQAQVLVTEVGGQPVNALYSLERQGTITCVLTYQARESAGRVSVAPLWQRFFEVAIGRGLERVDFNGNNAHLQRFSDGESRFNRFAFYHRGMYSSMLRCVADAASVLSRRLAPD